MARSLFGERANYTDLEHSHPFRSIHPKWCLMAQAALDTWPGRKRRTNEAGTTLLEVLIALGILAVGAVAVFTLFPLGVLEVARAIKDDRTAAVAAHAVDLA